MAAPHFERIARELSIEVPRVERTAALLAEGATVPFIARYRKEATGSLDEVAIARVRDRLAQLQALDQRREAIIASLTERNLLTNELQTRLSNAETLTALEDLYQPFRPKRHTRASVAREKGLEPLANLLLRQDPRVDPEKEAASYNLASIDEALQGARDIIAEHVSDDPDARAKMRTLFWQRGILRSQVRKGKDQLGAKFKDYFDWNEPVSRAPSHRVLAILRGEAEEVLTCSIEPSEQDALALLERQFLRGSSASTQQVRLAVHDGYKRLLARAMETETRAEAKRRADEAAITVFAQNVRQLLLAPPLGQKRVLAIDPGVRTGCKTVVLDAQGQLLHDTVIYPDQRRREAEQTITTLVGTYAIEAIAIGNGTAGRETETFIRSLSLTIPGSAFPPAEERSSRSAANPLAGGSASLSREEFPVQSGVKTPAGQRIPVVMVNEAGASIYSASDVAREEFPDRDITVRGAVSIGRRLMDPLAELVKIDPKSIGVGQYQHDVDQDALRQSLDDTVMSCVNGVGVEVNTASKQLLAYVSGLTQAVAQNIINYRNDNGPFTTRRDLLRVPRLGQKAFEQAAGLLRIHSATNPLDTSAVHPESYPIVDRMAADLGVRVVDLMRDENLRRRINLQRYVTETVGTPTLTDILNELARPGRDPRAQFEAVQFNERVRTLADLQPGMKLPGVVTNVTAFGAFVDIGVHQDGLVHISQLADRFVRDPNEVVRVNQPVEVRVLEVDLARKRIALSMRRSHASEAGQAGG